MDKTAIRNFAIEARKILMKSAIAEAGFYGISKDGVKAPIQKGKDFEVYETLAGTEKRIFGDDIKRRENLANAVKELGFEQVIEETAYTWFNRIIAIRFMEVNNYLPTRVRVLSSETGSSTPDIVTQADTVELNMSVAELESVQQAKQDNKYDEAFRLLFIKQCNELNAILPGLFEKTNDYMELLLKIPYTGDGVIRMLIDTIPEDNFNVDTEGQVEIIGWMYQYYNTELKDDTFAKLKKNVKITKERIPAATQLFTPDWIVRYMVENSLGRVWIEHLRAVDSSVDEKSKAEEFGWKYYLPEAEQEENVAAQLVDIRASYKSLTPQDITCIDPCMGSGHILVYMFDVLMDIYRSEGFSEREAVFDILEKNIRGLDIDRRAYQLSYFALMMKARGYNRIFFRGHENLDGERLQAVPQVYAIEESNSVNRDQLKYLGSTMSEIEKNNALNQLVGLLDQLVDAKEYGSILNIDNYDWDLLKKYVCDYTFSGQMNLEMVGIDSTISKIKKLIDRSVVMTQKYDAVITNPPYMGAAGMNDKLYDFVKTFYPETKSDMSTVSMEKTLDMCKPYGYMSMINIPVWMFIASYEKLRKMLIEKANITQMIHLGRGIFGSDFGTTTFVIRNVFVKSYIGTYQRLFEKQGSVDAVETKEKWFFEGRGKAFAKQDRYKKIPGRPIAYWVSDQFISNFSQSLISNNNFSGGRNKTHGNEQYTRLWWEISDQDRWQLYVKGGDFRRWYGNHDVVVDWSEEAKESYASHGGLYNQDYAGKEGICWTLITSAKTAFRYKVPEAHYDSGAPTIFNSTYKLDLALLGFLNSNVATEYLQLLNPTINMGNTYVLSLPMLSVGEHQQEIERLVLENIEMAKADWDSYETSRDFGSHPLVKYKKEDGLVETAFENWNAITQMWFSKMKQNEERINEIYIDIYGLEGEISKDVSDKDISIRKADKKREIKSLISYAVGCMLGRYSLDYEGVQCIGSACHEDEYITFSIDKDNIIPITDEPYFEDDIVNLFEKWVACVFGDEHLIVNMEFIASVISTSKGNYKEIIREYFLDEFYRDHCAIYSITGSGKRPIYWMFDSGKQNGFKCLMYLHRYNRDLIGLIRSDYLVKIQSAIENSLKNAEYVIANSNSSVDKAEATKKRDKYIKQLAEIKTYYQGLSHMGLQRIELDLNEGVKENYSKFQRIEVANEGEKKQALDLLAKL